LQGPHHSAKKSTRTGSVDFKTSWSKVLSDTAFAIVFFSFRGAEAAGGDRHLFEAEVRNAAR
jgi:hypothetical protein